MVKILDSIVDFVLIAVVADAIIVIITMFNIMQGGDVPNIPFWDWQIKLLARLIS